MAFNLGNELKTGIKNAISTVATASGQPPSNDIQTGFIPASPTSTIAPAVFSPITQAQTTTSPQPSQFSISQQTGYMASNSGISGNRSVAPLQFSPDTANNIATQQQVAASGSGTGVSGIDRLDIYNDQLKTALDRINNYASGNSQLDRNIANRYLNRVDASQAAATLSQAQRIASNPYLSEGAKNVAAVELQRMAGSQRSELAGKLAEQSQARAYNAANKYADLTLEAASKEIDKFEAELDKQRTDDNSRLIDAQIVSERQQYVETFRDAAVSTVMNWKDDPANADGTFEDFYSNEANRANLKSYYKALTGLDGEPSETWAQGFFSNVPSTNQARIQADDNNRDYYKTRWVDTGLMDQEQFDEIYPIMGFISDTGGSWVPYGTGVAAVGPDGKPIQVNGKPMVFGDITEGDVLSRLTERYPDEGYWIDRWKEAVSTDEETVKTQMSAYKDENGKPLFSSLEIDSLINQWKTGGSGGGNNQQTPTFTPPTTVGSIYQDPSDDSYYKVTSSGRTKIDLDISSDSPDIWGDNAMSIIKNGKPGDPVYDQLISAQWSTIKAKYLDKRNLIGNIPTDSPIYQRMLQEGTQFSTSGAKDGNRVKFNTPPPPPGAIINIDGKAYVVKSGIDVVDKKGRRQVFTVVDPNTNTDVKIYAGGENPGSLSERAAKSLVNPIVQSFLPPTEENMATGTTSVNNPFVDTPQITGPVSGTGSIYGYGLSSVGSFF